MKNLLKAITLIILYLLSIAFSQVDLIDISLIISIITSIFLVFYIKTICKSYSNLTIVFYAFSVLYGLSGPINVYWGEGLANIFGDLYDVGSFISVFCISNIGFIIGILFYNLFNKGKSNFVFKDISRLFLKEKVLIKSSLIFAFISMSFELINFMRVGGISALIQGKAYYQSAISELSVTVPVNYFADFAFAFFSLYIGININRRKKNNKMKILRFIIYMMPYLFVNIYLGKRGVLLSIIIIIFIGVTYLKPIKSIRPKLIIMVLLLYIIMGFLYANRGIAPLLFTDKNTFFELAFQKERIVKALNPGSNEFGAPFGNFNMFYINSNNKFDLLLGKSYVNGIFLMIPSIIYPGNKPQQIGYIFRDVYFPSEALRGSIAGTAFSSILEAYWNFSYFGVFFMYLFIGYMLQRLDKRISNKNWKSLVFYISLSPLVISFHRVSFGNIISAIAFKGIILYIFVCIFSCFIFDRNHNKVNNGFGEK
ncbi:hypothetical protein AN1V17_48510 [Vallitalea sediminicola]